VEQRGPSETDYGADLSQLRGPFNEYGTTDVDVVVVREGENIKGKLLGGRLGIIGKSVLGKELGKTVNAIEARNAGSRAAEPRVT
jgi:hypothetical protein